MNEREQKSFIRFLAGELKTHCREVMAFQLLVHTQKKMGVQGLDELLAKCRQSPELETQLNAQFVDLEKLLPPLAEAPVDQEFLGRLVRWKPSGRLH